MPIATGLKRKFDKVEDEGYLSDESAFYGTCFPKSSSQLVKTHR